MDVLKFQDYSDSKYTSRNSGTAAHDSVSRCFGCGRPIDGSNTVTVLNGIFHRNCFSCQYCRRILSLKHFGVQGGRPYCIPHCERRSEMDVPHGEGATGVSSGQGIKNYCFACGHIIEPHQLICAFEGVFHKDCFRCNECRRLLRLDNCTVVQGKLHCDHACHQSNGIPERRYQTPSKERTEKTVIVDKHRITPDGIPRSFSQTSVGGKADGTSTATRYSPSLSVQTLEAVCNSCGNLVSNWNRFVIDGKLFHRTCLRCRLCNRFMNTDEYQIIDGERCCYPKCIEYNTNMYVRGTSHIPRIASQILCTSSEKAGSRRMSANYERSNCPSQESQADLCVYNGLRSGTSSEHLQTDSNSNRTDGRNCYYCQKPVYATEQLRVMDRFYHRICFRCTMCNRTLSVDRFSIYEKKPYCIPHHDQVKKNRSSSLTNLGISYNGCKNSAADDPFINHNSDRGSKNEMLNYTLTRSQTAPTSTWQGSIEPHETSEEYQWNNQLCRVCGKHVNPHQCVALTDHVLHTDCAKCRTCHINLGVANCRELFGRVYCTPHFAQAFAEYIENRRKPELWRSSSFKRTKSSTPIIKYEVNSQNQAPSRPQSTNFERTSTSMSEICSKCNEVIQPETGTVIKGKWCHYSCLSCQKCFKQLSPFEFTQSGDKCYCSQNCSNASTHRDSFRRTASIVRSRSSVPSISVDRKLCHACSKNVYATEALYVMERVYHKNCFKCQQCRRSLGIDNYHALDGNPYCQPHYKQILFGRDGLSNVYHSRNGQEDTNVSSEPTHFFGLSTHPRQPKVENCVCKTCQQPVHPRDGIHILQQYYHYDCFKCAQCGGKLNMGRFEMAKGKAYCPEDFMHLFGRHSGLSSRQSLLHLSEMIRSRSAERR